MKGRSERPIVRKSALPPLIQWLVLLGPASRPAEVFKSHRMRLVLRLLQEQNGCRGNAYVDAHQVSANLRRRLAASAA